MELGKSIENQNDVVLRFAKHVITTVAKYSNLVFSPISINVMLSLIASGSNDNTKEQILSFLKSPSLDHLNAFIANIIYVVLADCNEGSDLRLSVANGVWIEKYISLKPSFKELLENYNTIFSQVDFAYKPVEVIDEVNTWAQVHTNGLIKEILKEDCIETIDIIRASSLILGNAVYFKGAWNEKFNSKLTRDNKFYLLDGTSMKVPFMTTYKNQYLRSYDGFKVLRLPYVEDHRQFSMYNYLPNDKDGLATLLEKMGSESGFLDNHIPQYKIDDMGLTSPFRTDEPSLTEMVESKKMCVSNIFHKACIKVNEKGTEAAAVTIDTMVGRCLSRKPDDFIADHPFIFTVREDKSGVVLFMGQVLDPSNSTVGGVRGNPKHY